jgi:hypothetical protein
VSGTGHDWQLRGVLLLADGAKPNTRFLSTRPDTGSYTAYACLLASGALCLTDTTLPVAASPHFHQSCYEMHTMLSCCGLQVAPRNPAATHCTC